eukprot:9213906-Karenia_brevis.AAC.1
MSSPTIGSLGRLRQIAQYLKGRPRQVWKYEFQAVAGTINMYTDAIWAGCQGRRKSASGGT